MRALRPDSIPALARCLLTALAFAAGAASAQPVTTLWMEFDPGSGQPVGTRHYDPASSTFNFTSKAPGNVSLTVSTTDYSGANVQLAPPTGQTFSLGAYEGALEFYTHGQAPGLRLEGAERPCYVLSGRFVVLELVYDSNFDMVSFAANIEARCTYGTMYGELRFNSAWPLTGNKPASASTPDPFVFLPRPDATPGTTVVSNEISVYGIRAPAAVQIIGGEYSLNGAAFTSSPGTANNRDRITVRKTASASYSTTATATLVVGGVSAPYNVTTFTPGVPFTALTLESATASNVGYGGYVEARAPDWAVTASHSSGSQITVQFRGPGGRNYQVRVATPPLGGVLAVGPYEDAYRDTSGASPGLNVTGTSLCYYPTSGRFVIHEMQLGPGASEVSRLAMSFESWCSTGEPIFGEVRINSPLPLPSMVITDDTTPDAFALKAQMPVRAGALVRSNWITISGVNRPVPVSIVGGEYSLNGGPFTSLAGMANPRDDIVVQATASRLPGAVRSATFTAGGVSASLAVTTYQAGMVLNGLYYRSTSGDSVGAGQTRVFMAPPNLLSLVRQSTNGVGAAVTGTKGTYANLELGSASGPIQPGIYENAASNAYYATGNRISFGTSSGSCYYTGSGRFTVYAVNYAADGAPDLFSADFEQRCGQEAPLFGEVRLNSTTPFSFLLGNECTADRPECVADVGVSLTASSNPAATGKDLVLTLTSSNQGPGVAHDVRTSIPLSGVTVAWMQPGCGLTSGTVTCNAGSLAVGASATHRIVIRPVTPSTLSLTATVQAEEIDTASANNSSAATIGVTATPGGVPITRYRLYSPVTQEHHFTTDLNEYTVLGTYADTWVQEGAAGKVLNNPGTHAGVSAVPYYRLYDSNTRWHHWTTDANEYYTLIEFPGWNGEGVDGYILPSAATGTIPLYRLMYPFVPGLHHWTIDANEYNALTTTYGWIGEGGSGFVIQ